MKFPKFLEEKGTIRLVSPSLGCNTEPYYSRLKSAIDFFKNNGYKVKEGNNIFSSFDGTKKTSYKRALEINEAFLDKEQEVLLSVGGGELMYQILDDIDFALLTKNPKWFMGYSDNTNLTFLLPTICDMAAIYGINAGDFGLKDMHESVSDTLLLLKGKKIAFSSYPKWELEAVKSEYYLASWNLTEETKIINYPPMDISFSGRLIGGCLDVLLDLVGTKYDQVKEFINKYKEDGTIWFIEACDLNVLAIRRAFIHLKRAGWFNYAKGFIIGRPRSAFNQEIFAVNQYNAITEVIADIPIIFDADIGHLKPTMPIICGSYAHVSSKNNKLTIKMELK